MISLIYTCFILTSISQSVLSSCLTPTQIAACDALFDPDALTYSCCASLDPYIVTQNKCLASNSCSGIFTCSVSKCVIGEYQLTDCDGNVDEAKVRAFLDQLESQQPQTRYTNQLIRANCLNYGFRRYVTSDPNCDTMMFEVCSFVNSLFGCPQLRTMPARCCELASNVEICRPVIDQYLNERNPVVIIE